MTLHVFITQLTLTSDLTVKPQTDASKTAKTSGLHSDHDLLPMISYSLQMNIKGDPRETGIATAIPSVGKRRMKEMWSSDLIKQ